jgi:hypothetical protein
MNTNPEYFALHARKFYEAAKLGNYELAEWEAQLLIQPFIKQDEESARRTADISEVRHFPATNRQSGAFVGRRATTPAARHWVSVQQRSG